MVSVEIEKIHEWSGLSRAWKVNLTVESTAFVSAGDKSYATYVVSETVTGEIFEAGGVKMEEVKYKTTH